MNDHRNIAARGTGAPGAGHAACAHHTCVGAARCLLETADPRESIEHLSRRANALAKLLEPSAGRPFANALEAIAIAYKPRAAGIAFLQPGSADLFIDEAWVDGPFDRSCAWPARSDLLRELASGEGIWSGVLSGAELPLSGHLGTVADAEVTCRALTSGGDIVGILFHVAGDEGRGTLHDFGYVDRLVADHLSRQIEAADEIRQKTAGLDQFRDAAETSFDWFWEIDADLRIVHLAKQWCDMVDIAPADLLGRTFSEVGINTRDTRWGRFLDQLVSVGEVHGFDARAVGPTGCYHYWKINGRAFHDAHVAVLGYRGSCTDVSAEVMERARAEKAERLLHEAIESLPQGFLLFDEHDRLVVCNERYKALFPEIAEFLVPGGDIRDITRKWAASTPERPEGVSVDDLITRRLRAFNRPRREYETRRADGRAHLVNEQKTASGSSVCLYTDITTLKTRERELEALGEVLQTRNHQFDITLDSISDGLMMMSSNGKLVLCNRRWQEMFAVPDDLCLEGTDIAELVDNFQSRGLAPQLVDKYRGKWQQVREAGELTFPWERPDGRLFEITAVTTRDDGLLVAYRDITLAERQSAVLREQATQYEALSRALAQQNSYFDGALNAMVQALAMFDANDRLIVCNKRFQEILGLPDDLVEKGVSVSLIGEWIENAGLMEAAADRVASTHAAAREHGSLSVKMRFRDSRVFEVRAMVLDNRDVLITFNEITEMERHTARLNEYAERLESSNRELEEFAYVASHDLQEPLRKIEAFGDRLRQKYGDRLDANGQAYLDRMLHASRRMRGLISDLLDYSRTGTKNKPLVQVNLGAVVEGVLADLEIALEASGAEVTICELPALDVDESQMRRLFQNLIANAVKFRKPDVKPKISITAEAQSAAGGGQVCCIQVRDNGIGFDNKHSDQVFKIFHRLHGRSEYEGTGIGLATCRKIVDRHAGTIVASSEPGVGTTITICLPMSGPVRGE